MRNLRLQHSILKVNENIGIKGNTCTQISSQDKQCYNLCNTSMHFAIAAEASVPYCNISVSLVILWMVALEFLTSSDISLTRICWLMEKEVCSSDVQISYTIHLKNKHELWLQKLGASGWVVGRELDLCFLWLELKNEIHFKHQS